jgi:hypothetical protein
MVETPALEDETREPLDDESEVGHESHARKPGGQA